MKISINRSQIQQASTNCAICLVDLNTEDDKGEQDIVINVHCGHLFHQQCTYEWLNLNLGCPLCRRAVSYLKRLKNNTCIPLPLLNNWQNILIVAVREGDYDVVEALIMRGADVNVNTINSSEDETPLYIIADFLILHDTKGKNAKNVLCLLGNKIQNGLGCKVDYNRAFKLFAKAAKLGSVEAKCNMGYAYRDGKGVTKNFVKALYWFNEAKLETKGNYADLDSSIQKLCSCANGVKIQGELGLSYFLGKKEINKNLDQALYWLNKAASKGCHYSQRQLGVIFTTDRQVKSDINKGIYWFKKAAAQGCQYSKYQLGLIHKSGKGTFKKNIDEAIYWFVKASNDGCRYARYASYELGLIFQSGAEEVKIDISAAIFWFRKAAISGDIHSRIILKNIYKLKMQDLTVLTEGDIDELAKKHEKKHCHQQTQDSFFTRTSAFLLRIEDFFNTG